MKRIGITAMIMLLGACSKPAPATEGGGTSEPSNPPPPASAPVLGGVDLSQDLRLVGTEPFWGVQIDSRQIKLSGAQRPEITVANPGPRMSDHSAVWESHTSDGAALRVTLTDTACSDGMSDRKYPLSAVVVFGAETLKGCGDKLEVFLKPSPKS